MNKKNCVSHLVIWQGFLKAICPQTTILFIPVEKSIMFGKKFLYNLFNFFFIGEWGLYLLIKYIWRCNKYIIYIFLFATYNR